MSSAADMDGSFVVLGKITSIYGIKGWVKIFSYTEPKESIFQYNHWFLQLTGFNTEVEIDQYSHKGKYLIAHIVGCDDRDIAQNYRGALIKVKKEVLPKLESDELYWHQLEGLDVKTKDDMDNIVFLGKIDYLMETGANDVVVVEPYFGSIDQKKRLIPWLYGQVIKDIDLKENVMWVDWDPSF